MRTTKSARAFTSLVTEREEQTRQQIENKWIGKGGVNLAHPPSCGSIGVKEAKVLSQRTTGTVCEIGCGTGRLAKHFKPKNYLGLDINHISLDIAEKRNPKHKFDLIMWDSLYPTADTYLLYTVMMHIPDGEVYRMV